MPGVYKLEAVVLRKRHLGEADVIVSLLSPTHGRLDAVAKGARRSSTARAGKLEPFSHVRVLLAGGRSLDVISQVELVHAWPGVLLDLERIASATYLLELFESLTEPGPNPSAGRIFASLTRALDEVSDASSCLAEPGRPGSLLGRGQSPTPSGVPLDLVCRRAELRLLTVLGFVPQVDTCLRCGAPPTRFLVDEGAGLCEGCLGIPHSGESGRPDSLLGRGQSPTPCAGRVLPLDAAARRLLTLLRTPGLDALASEAIPRVAAEQVERILRSHIEWHWPTRFRSRRFLEQSREPSS